MHLGISVRIRTQRLALNWETLRDQLAFVRFPKCMICQISDLLRHALGGKYETTFRIYPEHRPSWLWPLSKRSRYWGLLWHISNQYAYYLEWRHRECFTKPRRCIPSPNVFNLASYLGALVECQKPVIPMNNWNRERNIVRYAQEVSWRRKES